MSKFWFVQVLESLNRIEQGSIPQIPEESEGILGPRRRLPCGRRRRTTRHLEKIKNFKLSISLKIQKKWDKTKTQMLWNPVNCSTTKN